MRYLNTLYVRHHRARIRHRRGALLVSTPDGSQRVPLEAIDALILLGFGQITTQAMEACVRRGVRIAALRQGGSVRFVVGPGSGGNVHLRLALYRALADHGWSLRLAKAVVAAKVQNCRKVVGRWARDATDSAVANHLRQRAIQILGRIPRVMDAETADGVRGIEGDAARLHFSAMRKVLVKTNLSFSTRTRRPPRDPTNSLLGFCYGLMLTEFVGATEAVGLDHQMGFFHRPRSGRPSLALDLAEELRPITDRFVVSLIRLRQIGPSGFTETPGGAVYLSDEGRAAVIRAWERHKETEFDHPVLGGRVARWALPSVQATLLARHLRGDLPVYPPPS